MRGHPVRSAPFPQLLPSLDENLDLSGTWKSVVNEPAIAVGSLIKIPNAGHTEMREILTEFLQFSSLNISPLPRSGRLAMTSEWYQIRLLFAIKNPYWLIIREAAMSGVIPARPTHRIPLPRVCESLASTQR
jgi:hypothetical protein